MTKKHDFEIVNFMSVQVHSKRAVKINFRISDKFLGNNTFGFTKV
jgi:hypothetical protein